jgi:hypothetical protein
MRQAPRRDETVQDTSSSLQSRGDGDGDGAGQRLDIGSSGSRGF